ncbi:MAG: ThuA domain-containing protein [Bacteroidota bacterium]
MFRKSNLLSLLFLSCSFSFLAQSSGTHLLVFSKTNGFRHHSITAGIAALAKMSNENNWTITFTEDSTHFSEGNLKQYNSVIFLNTTQNVLGKNEEQAFEKYMNQGGGFVGIHAAADTEYSWDFYATMLGAQFASHPKTQEAKMNVHKNCNHPSIAHLEETWIKTDEWYNFKKPVPSYVNVLLDMDESSYEGKRMDMYHPIAWYHSFEGGRVFYTGLGHTPKTFSNETFLEHLKNGILWTAGKIHVATPQDWTNLLDEKFTHWDKFMGVPHVSVDGIGDHPTSENVHVGTPMGVNNDPKNVFKMIKENGEDVLHVSGEIYGGLTSKQEYQNYHLKLEYRWGDKKWAPRLQQKKDSGLLYHCTGRHGAFWNVWMRCLEYQIQEGDTGDFIALAGTNVMARSQPTDDGKNYQFDRDGKWLAVGSEHGNWACTKKSTHENPHGEWNTVELYVIEDQAIHVINGHVVNVVKDAHTFQDDKKIPLVRGKLQLQSEAAEIFYKDVKIRALEAFPVELKEQVGL